MNDAAYIFKQTSAERKRIGRGDYNKKRQGGRYVRLPSDNMTKKEKEAMNSVCLSYNMNAPVKWWQFKDWPDDIKTEYLQRLNEIYRASTLDISLMMGTSYDNIRLLKQRLGLASKRGGKRPGVDKKLWAEFCGTPEAVSDLGEESVKCAQQTDGKVSKSEDSPSEKVPNCAEIPSEKVRLGTDSIMNIAILLDALKGSGAKLTIEVTL
ncbi:MAG: hypothetical protein IJI06_04480 [Oscillospiraceae bacterium]|nr:hypothetical protein [Oscillospiraceae bacterium]